MFAFLPSEEGCSFSWWGTESGSVAAVDAFVTEFEKTSGLESDLFSDEEDVDKEGIIAFLMSGLDNQVRKKLNGSDIIVNCEYKCWLLISGKRPKYAKWWF